MIEQSTAAKPGHCRDCGQPVVAFRIKEGFLIQLEDHDLPVTVDIADPAIHGRLWQHLGPTLGWAAQFAATRTWRPLRAQHQCAVLDDNKQQTKEKQK